VKKGQVYGSGMIAKAFLDIRLPDDVVIIAAGVSNSQEVLASEFSREKEMLEAIILEHKYKKIVYFSSCSIYQSKLTPYVKHKLAMEKLIVNNAENYYICRLPQVVGVTTNNTIISYFVKCVINQDMINIYSKTKRYLIDVNDIVRVVLMLITNRSSRNSIIDICNGTKTPIQDLVETIGRILSIEPLVNVINSGETYDIPSFVLKATLLDNDPIYNPHYADNILKKYVPLLATQYDEISLPERK
jgi:nucleoside-diphosphate-sugar epimerase